MANMYRSVLSGGGTTPTGDAIASDVLTGKTFSNANATGISGTMPNNGAVSGTATPSQPYTVPAGYHNGNGTVRAVGSGNPVTDLVDDSYQILDLGSITSGQIVSGTALSFSVNVVVIANIKDFNTAATTDQPITTVTRVSNDGITWTTPTAGENNIANYDYAMLQSTATGYGITFTT